MFIVNAKSRISKIDYPIEHGVVKNWDNMEKIWKHVFTNELKVNPDEQNVLITNAPMNPKKQKEKTFPNYV